MWRYIPVIVGHVPRIQMLQLECFSGTDFAYFLARSVIDALTHRKISRVIHGTYSGDADTVEWRLVASFSRY